MVFGQWSDSFSLVVQYNRVGVVVLFADVIPAQFCARVRRKARQLGLQMDEVAGGNVTTVRRWRAAGRLLQPLYRRFFAAHAMTVAEHVKRLTTVTGGPEGPPQARAGKVLPESVV